MQEIWKPVLGYEGRYEVSNLGAVRTVGRYISAPQGRIRWLPERNLSTHITARGYVQTMFKVGSKAIHQLAHRLVAEAFIPNNGDLPQVNHLDGDKQNNCSTNLEWTTSQDNCLHARHENLYEQARGEKAGGAKLTAAAVVDIRERAASGITHDSLSRTYGIDRSAITRIINRQRWAHIP